MSISKRVTVACAAFIAALGIGLAAAGPAAADIQRPDPVSYFDGLTSTTSGR